MRMTSQTITTKRSIFCEIYMDECYKVSYPFCNVFDFVKFPIKSKPESLVPKMKCQIQFEYQEFGLKLFIVSLSI